MKTRLLALVCCLCTLSLAACGAKEAAPVSDAPGAQIANPFVDYATLAEAEAAAGFPLSAPLSIDGFDEPMIQLMSGKMLQLIFRSGDDRLIIRKAAGSEDISGDSNTYPETKTAKITGRERRRNSSFVFTFRRTRRSNVVCSRLIYFVLTRLRSSISRYFPSRISSSITGRIRLE